MEILSLGHYQLEFYQFFQPFHYKNAVDAANQRILETGFEL